MFAGINTQIFNTPIDLFIEDFLYENYKELRPFQFISLYSLITEGIKAVTDKRLTSLTPIEIISASKILNIVNAIQFKDLFGFDLISKFNASSFELKEATRFYVEFKEYRRNSEPAKEYELVQRWGADLKLSKYFELVNEEDFRNRPKDFESQIKSIQEDPFGFNQDTNLKTKEMEAFKKSQEVLGLNMAVVMFMVDALQYLKNLSPEKIKQIAMEIAMVGTQGIKPGEGHKYKLTNIPGKDFSGYHLLSYYYVSWKIAIPEMLEQIKLPYDKEYDLAKKMYDGGMK